MSNNYNECFSCYSEDIESNSHDEEILGDECVLEWKCTKCGAGWTTFYHAVHRDEHTDPQRT